MENFPIYFIGAIVAVLLFLAARVLMLWYWRVNDIVNVLQSIDAKLGGLPAAAAPVSPSPNVAAAAAPQSSTSVPPAPPKPIEYVRCEYCEKQFNAEATRCPKCMRKRTARVVR